LIQLAGAIAERLLKNKFPAFIFLGGFTHASYNIELLILA